MSEKCLEENGNEWIDERLVEIDYIQDSSKKVETLLEMASELLPSREEVLKKALSKAQENQGELYYLKALCAITPKLATDNQSLLEVALSAAEKLSGYHLAKALAAIAPHLPPAQKVKVLEKALRTLDEFNEHYGLYRWGILAKIISQLPSNIPSLLEAALSAAEKLDEYQRAQAIAEIVPLLPSDNQSLLEKALIVADEINDGYYKVDALVPLVSQLPSDNQSLLEKAWSAVEKLGGHDRIKVLVALVSQLPSDNQAFLDKILSNAERFQPESNRIKALAGLTPKLPSEYTVKVLEAALSATEKFWSDLDYLEVLAMIAPQLPSDNQSLLDVVLSAAEKFENASYRVEVLAAIAPQLPPGQKVKALESALSEAENYEGEDLQYYPSEALAKIAPQLPLDNQSLLEKALCVAERIEDEEYRVRALTALAPQLPLDNQSLLEKALCVAERIEDEEYRVQALTVLAPQLPSGQKVQLLEAALSSVGMVKDNVYPSKALAKIAPQLPSDNQVLLARTFSTAEKLEDDSFKSFRAQALAKIAPQLPSDNQSLLEKALGIAEKLEDEYDRVKVLVALAPQWPSDNQSLLEKALGIAEKLEDVKYRVKALAKIAPQLPSDNQSLLEKAMSIADKLEDVEYRVQALAEISPQLPSDNQSLIEAVLSIVEMIGQEEERVKFLTRIADQLPPDNQSLLEKALGIAEKLDKHDRTKVLTALIPQLPSDNQSLLEKALSIADKLEDEYSRTKVLTALIPQLPSDNQALLERALSIAEKLGEYSRTKVLTALAPQWPSDNQSLLEKALSIADKLEDEYSRAKALTALIPQWPSDNQALLERALGIAEKLDKYDRIKVLVALAPQLPSDNQSLLEKALSIADKLEDEYSRTKALTAFIPQLPSDNQALLERALSIAEKLGEYSRVEVLVALVPQWPSDNQALFEKALSVAERIEDEYSRVEVLVALIPQLPSDNQALLERALSVADKIQDKYYTSFRAQVLAAIAPLATYQSENLALCLPKSKHSFALELARYIQQDTDKTTFLSAFAPLLSPGLFPKVLRLLEETFTTYRYRTEAFCNFAPYLPLDQLPEALQFITCKLKPPHHQTTALETLLPLLPFDQLDTVLDLLPIREPIKDKFTITLPAQQARVLSCIAMAISVQQPSTNKPDEFKALSALFIKTLNLTQKLKDDDSITFSYQREAARIFSQLAPMTQYLSEKDKQQFLICLDDKNVNDLGYKAQILSAFFRAQVHPPNGPEITKTLKRFQSDDYSTFFNIQVRTAYTYCFDANELDPLRKSIQGQYKRTLALVEMARHPKGHSYQTESLREIRKLPQHLQLFCLQQLIPSLKTNQCLEVANIISEIKDENDTNRALVILACAHPQFRNDAKTQTLASLPKDKNPKKTIQCIAQLSILAIEVPEILPEIIDIAENFEPSTDPENLDDLVQEPLACAQILSALSPHLPMRINREVQRERFLSRPITKSLWNRALFLLARGYRDALKGGSLRNEFDQVEDLLNLKDEVNALADLILMRDLSPPMAVGILGGWGGGKSYIMHLMQNRMTEVRSRKVNNKTEAWNEDPNHEKLSPYVGHIYQIKFDAWTFAKSDLWASLMQTIFFELDRQLTLETQITRILDNVEPEKRYDLETKIWPVLYKTNDEDRKWFLEQVLTDQALLNQLSEQNVGQTTGQLWKTLLSTQQAAVEQLKATQDRLEIYRRELDIKKATIRKGIKDQLAPLHKINEQKNFQRIDTLLGTSFVLLRQRIGPRLFQEFHEKIHEKLYGKFDNSSQSDSSIGLWEELSQTLEDLEKAKKELANIELTSSKPLKASSSNSTSDNASTSSASSPKKPSHKIAEEIEKTKKIIDDLFQKSEGLKIDIETVAINVIEHQNLRVNLLSRWQWVKQNWIVILLFLALFLSPLLMWNFFGINVIKEGEASLKQILTWIAAILTPVLPTLVTLQSLLRSSHKWFQETQLALHEYEKSVENRNKQLEIKIETTIQDKLQKDEDFLDLELQVRQLETQIEQQKQALPVNEYASLNDFVNDRLSSKTYANCLGLMHQVKEDLFNLSNKLLPPSSQSLESKIKFLKNTFPRGPARVVVYIDDLDRCPPDRVVEVLEAVQLLVKTPLFIAVLAIDERYITRSLEKFYEGVLSRRGRPSGTDYLEKIIQLPYRVRPIMANTLESYLRSQVFIQDNAKGEVKFSEFSRQEFNLLLSCCQQIDLSPRTLKRLTNVYKLFKIVCRTRATKLSFAQQQAILALLALSGRYPDLMRGIFSNIEICFEEQRDEKKAQLIDRDKASSLMRPSLHKQSPLKDFFKNYQLLESNRYLQRELDQLMHDVLQTNILPDKFTLEDMTHENFNLIRSFSFVGEIGEDPEDYRIVTNGTNKENID